MWPDLLKAKGVDYSVWWADTDEKDDPEGDDEDLEDQESEGPTPEEEGGPCGPMNVMEAYAFAKNNNPDFTNAQFLDDWFESEQSSVEAYELLVHCLVTSDEYAAAFKKYLDVKYFTQTPADKELAASVKYLDELTAAATRLHNRSLSVENPNMTAEELAQMEKDQEMTRAYAQFRFKKG
jgi:hypothetical protein